MRKQQASRRLKFRGQMSRIRLEVHQDDLAFIKNFILADAQSRCDLLQMRDIETRRNPEWRGIDTFVYTFLCFPETNSLLFFLQNNLAAQRAVPGTPSQEKERMLSKLLADQTKNLRYPTEDPWK